MSDTWYVLVQEAPKGQLYKAEVTQVPSEYGTGELWVDDATWQVTHGPMDYDEAIMFVSQLWEQEIQRRQKPLPFVMFQRRDQA